MDEKTMNTLANEIDDATTEVAPENVENLKDVVYLTLNKNYVKTDFTCSDGKIRNVAFVPKGTKINGKDVSGYSFFPKYVNDHKFLKNCCTLSYLESFNINLVSKDEKVVVSPSELKEALNESWREWKQEKKAERDEKKTLDNKLEAAEEKVEKENKKPQTAEKNKAAER